MTKKRFFRLVIIALLLGAIGFMGLWVYVRQVVTQRRFPVEARLLNGEGHIGFVPLNYRQDNQKSIDEVAASAAVLMQSGLWIKLLVMAGDREYAFCPFGRVFVLRSAAFDSTEVESSS